MKKVLALTATLFSCASVFMLASCNNANSATGTYDFVIYERDSNNYDLSDNPVVARYTISYTEEKYVSDTLIKKEDNKYYFTTKSDDYLVLVDGDYGLSYTEGYFKNYSGCKDGAIDVSWAMTLVDGTVASYGIGSQPIEGVKEYAFVIDGWKTE